MYEHHRQPLLSREKFIFRFLHNATISAGLVAISIGIGVAGYHYIEGIPWIDSILNASMILTGMGPVDPMKTTAGKLFASAYALFSGVAFLTMAAVLFAPVIHRFLHRFHLDLEEEDDGEGRKVKAKRRNPKDIN